MTTTLHNYPAAPPNPWCQGCGLDFDRHEYPIRWCGRDYCSEECLENDQK